MLLALAKVLEVSIDLLSDLIFVKTLAIISMTSNEKATQNPTD